MLQADKLVGDRQSYWQKTFSLRRRRGAKLATHGTIVSIEELI